MTRPAWLLAAVAALALSVLAARCSTGLRFDHDPVSHID